MLVPDLLGLKVLLVGGVVNLLENVLEASIVLLEDGVLGAHVQRVVLVEGELERSVGETGDGLVRVVLGLSDAAVLELKDLNFFGLASLGSEDHGELAGALNHLVLGAVLIAEGVAADNDGLLPAGDEARDSRNDNWLTENGTAKSVSDCAIGREPHCRGCWLVW